MVCLGHPAGERSFRGVPDDMSKFGSEQTRAAIARLAQQSDDAIHRVLANARRLNNEELVQACLEEQRVRGSIKMSAMDAKQALKASMMVAGKPLREVIEIAFREVKAKPEELLVLRWIAHHPGTSYSQASAAYGKGDLGLLLGHLVYHRFGFFRPLLASATYSDVLLERESNSPAGVCYRLRPETLAALETLGILGPAG